MNADDVVVDVTCPEVSDYPLLTKMAAGSSGGVTLQLTFEELHRLADKATTTGYVVGHFEYHGPEDAMVKKPKMVYYGPFATPEAAQAFGDDVGFPRFEIKPVSDVVVNIHAPDTAPSHD